MVLLDMLVYTPRAGGTKAGQRYPSDSNFSTVLNMPEKQ